MGKQSAKGSDSGTSERVLCPICRTPWVGGATRDIRPRRPGMKLLTTVTCERSHEFICEESWREDDDLWVDLGDYVGQPSVNGQ